MHKANPIKSLTCFCGSFMMLGGALSTLGFGPGPTPGGGGRPGGGIPGGAPGGRIILGGMPGIIIGC